jgi:hypothetical protein
MNPMTRFTSFFLASLVLIASSSSAQPQQEEVTTTGQRPPDCFGDEVTIDFSNHYSLLSNTGTRSGSRRARPLLYTLERGATLPPGLVLDRRTGIVTGVLRDRGFQNVYNITVVGTDPTESATPYDRLHRSSVVVTSTWCTGARISRFLLVPTTTTTTTTRTHNNNNNNNKVTPTRSIHNGDTIHLGCSGGGGVRGSGFNLEVETFSEFSREAQSEGDLTGHVEFVLDGRLVRTERAFPFTLGGFDVNRGFLDFKISPGPHTLTAIPYNPSGHEGSSKTITFTIVVGVVAQEGEDCCGATTTY